MKSSSKVSAVDLCGWPDQIESLRPAMGTFSPKT